MVAHTNVNCVGLGTLEMSHRPLAAAVVMLLIRIGVPGSNAWAAVVVTVRVDGEPLSPVTSDMATLQLAYNPPP